jgi:hypothetical protein
VFLIAAGGIDVKISLRSINELRPLAPANIPMQVWIAEE